jgi:glycine cleavage system H protein
MSEIEGYTKSHEWVKVEDDIAIVGITEYAQDQLSDVVFVELPEVGDEAIREEEIAVVESTKIAAPVYAPVNGEIVEVNSALEDQPELVNNSPTEEGWLVKIRINDMDELEELMSEGEYNELIESEME